MAHGLKNGEKGRDGGLILERRDRPCTRGKVRCARGGGDDARWNWKRGKPAEGDGDQCCGGRARYEAFSPSEGGAIDSPWSLRRSLKGLNADKKRTEGVAIKRKGSRRQADASPPCSAVLLASMHGRPC
jgi:hypothetical protein